MEENLLSTVRDYIEINAKEKAKANFISCPHTNQNISNDKLKHNLDKINYYLVNKKKLKKKSIICTLTENSLSSIQLMLGIMYSGMVQVPLNLVAGEDQLAYIIEHSESKIIFSTKNNIELAEKIIKKVSTKIELVEIDKNNFLEEIDNNFDIFGMSEIGLNWAKIPRQRHLSQHIRRLKWGVKSKVITATNEHNKIGTAIVIRGDLIHRCTNDEKDEKGLERWVSTLLNGKNRKTRVVAIYRPNKGGNQSTVFSQQERYLESINDKRDPLTAFDEDLEGKIQH